MATIIGAAPPQPSKDDLLAQLKDCVKKLVDTDITAEVEPERQFLYQRVMKNDKYWRGLQFLTESQGANGIEYSQVGVPQGTNDGATGAYDYVQNIYRGDGKKFIAVLGQRSPNVVAVADDPTDEESIKRTQDVETAVAILDSKWKVDEVHMQAMQGFWTAGTQFIYTPYVADGDKYGWRDEPQIQAAPVPTGEAEYHCIGCGADTPQAQVDANNPVCPQCQQPLGPQDLKQPDTMDVPQDGGMQRYPNGMVECILCDLFSISGPYATKNVEEMTWISYETEVYKGKLLKTYPRIRKMGDLENQGAGAGSELGKQVRALQASPSGTNQATRQNYWSHKLTWITPDVYESISDDRQRKILQEHFNEGLKITMVSGEVIDLDNEKLSDVWAIGKPESSKYIFCDPSGQDMMSVQDITNNSLNIAAEIFERGLPVTIVDPLVIDQKQWSQHRSTPAEIIPALHRVGESLGDAFHEMPAAEFSGQMIPWVQGVQNQGREIVGVLPAIFGGDGGGTQTAREAELKKNAALQQLGTIWLGARKMWEKAKTNGVKQLARYGGGVLRGTKKGAQGAQALTLDVAELKEDGWHLEAEEAIPETWAQKRDLLMWMMTQSPQVQQGWGLSAPENIEENSRYLGFPGHYIPGLDQREKTRETIQQLLLAAPVPSVDGSSPPTPSIPADDFADDPSMALTLVKNWCLSDAGRTAAKETPDGFANVVAFGKAYAAMIPQPTPPPVPPPPGFALSGKIEDTDPTLVAAVLGSHNVQWTPPAAPALPVAPQVPGAPPPPPAAPQQPNQ